MLAGRAQRKAHLPSPDGDPRGPSARQQPAGKVGVVVEVVVVEMMVEVVVVVVKK